MTRLHRFRRTRPASSLRGSEDGYVTIWMLLWTPVLVAGLATIVDYGAGIQARALASDAAIGAARAGAAQVVSVTGEGPAIDNPAALASAADYVAQANREAPNRVDLAGSYRIDADTVEVTVTVTYDPWLLETMTTTFTRNERAQMQVGQ